MEDNIEDINNISPNKYRKIEINENNTNNDQNITIFSILKQAIQSKDKNMLENALSFNDPKIIKYSLLKLTDNYCLELFEEIMNRIESNPMKLLELKNWISIIINRIGKISINLNGDIEGTTLIMNQMERLNEITNMRLSYNKDLIHLQSTLDIFQHLIEENKIMTEMCKKLSSESNNALITYHFDNQDEEKDDDEERDYRENEYEDEEDEYENKEDFEEEDEYEDENKEDEEEDDDDEDEEEEEEEEDDDDYDEDDKEYKDRNQ